MSGVPRIGRLLDGAGALILLVGVGLVGRAWVGFREVQSFQPGPDAPPMAAMELADHFWLMQRGGVALIVIGVGVFVGAAVVARRVAGRRDRVTPGGS